jgi:hypothetical protein
MAPTTLFWKTVYVIHVLRKDVNSKISWIMIMVTSLKMASLRRVWCIVECHGFVMQSREITQVFLHILRRFLKTELFMFTDWLTELCEKLRTFSTFLKFLQKKMGTRFACFSCISA